MKNLKIVKNQTEFPLSMYLFYFLTFHSVYSVLHLHKLALLLLYVNKLTEFFS